ncbi:MAG: hypothetical protein AAF078_14645, partial [Planctomycetota bacterium]
GIQVVEAARGVAEDEGARAVAAEDRDAVDEDVDEVGVFEVRAGRAAAATARAPSSSATPRAASTT